MNLDGLTLEQLNELEQALKDKKTLLEGEVRSKLKSDILGMINGLGFVPKLFLTDMLADFEIAEIKQKSFRTRAPAAIKYRQGENTWTGRGKRPNWVTGYLANGGKLEEIEVK